MAHAVRAIPPTESTDAWKVHLSNKFVNRISVIALSLTKVAVAELEEIMKLQFLKILDLGSNESVFHNITGLAQLVSNVSFPNVQSKNVQLSPENNISCAVVHPKLLATSNTNEQFL